MKKQSGTIRKARICGISALVILLAWAAFQLLFTNTFYISRCLDTAEKLTQTIPGKRDGIQANIDLASSVRDILNAKSGFLEFRATSDPAKILWWENGAKESLDATDSLTWEEKEQISALSANELFTSYHANVFRDAGDIGQAVFLCLEYVPKESEQAFLQDSFYYLEKVSEHWYLYVLIDRISPSQWIPHIQRENRGKTGIQFLAGNKEEA